MTELPANDSLRELQAYLWQAITERNLHHESANQKFVMLMEEVGELARAVRQESGIKFSDTTARSNVAEELADVQIVLLVLASVLKIDMLDAVRSKEAKNRTRTWK